MKSYLILILTLVTSFTALTSGNIFDAVISPFAETCNEAWIPANMTTFQEKFHQHVFGQPLVINLIKNAVSAHFKGQPKRALVLSLHGWPGVGKNFVSNLLVKSLFFKGIESSFFKHYNARADFTLESRVDEYTEKLQKEITESLGRCGKSVFVFDEIDMMPPKLIDAIHPFIDYQERVNGVDPRRAIFIFLSNKGGRNIADITFDLWKKGIDRSKFEGNDFKEAIRKSAFHEKGGLQFCDNIQAHLVTFFIPFLPLQTEHVKLCIEAELDRRNYYDSDGKVTSEVLEQVTFTKKDSPSGGLFAVSGCKNLDSIVATVIEKYLFTDSHTEF